MIGVHIGLKKSGSSSIQTFLSANQKALGQLGVDYPRVGRGSFNAHHNFPWELMDRPKFIPRRGGLDELSRYLQKERAPVCLLSSEMFEGCATDQVARFRDVLREHDDQVRVILYIRNLVSLMPSSYAQKVKHGKHAYDFDAFFAERMSHIRTDYFMTAEAWASAFGWEAIRVRPLEPERLVNGDLIDDLLESLDLDPNAPAARALARPGIVNPAPGWRVLEAIRGLANGRHGLAADHPLARVDKSDPAGNAGGRIACGVITAD